MKTRFNEDYQQIKSFYVNRNLKQSRFSLINEIIKIYDKESKEQNHSLKIKLKVKMNLLFMSKSKLLEIKFDYIKVNGLLLEILFSHYPITFKSYIKDHLFTINEKVLNITLLNFYEQKGLENSTCLRNLITMIPFLSIEFREKRELFKINETEKNIEKILIQNTLSKTKKIRL